MTVGPAPPVPPEPPLSRFDLGVSVPVPVLTAVLTGRGAVLGFLLLATGGPTERARRAPVGPRAGPPDPAERFASGHGDGPGSNTVAGCWSAPPVR